MLLEMLADGRLHLTGAGKLAPHLTVENRAVLLARATRQSKRRIEELIAELCPQPDVPARIRKLPERPAKAVASQLRPDAVGCHAGNTDGCDRSALGTTPASLLDTHQPAVASSPTPGAPAPPQQPLATSMAPAPPQVPPPAFVAVAPARVRLAPTALARVSPLAPGRFKVQFTASAELREKLERLQELMRSSGPAGDLAAVIEAAVTEKCTERHRLEFHHAGKAWARGGDHGVGNIRLACKLHNQHLADLEYGREWMDHCRRRPERVLRLQPF